MIFSSNFNVLRNPLWKEKVKFFLPWLTMAATSRATRTCTFQFKCQVFYEILNNCETLLKWLCLRRWRWINRRWSHYFWSWCILEFTKKVQNILLTNGKWYLEKICPNYVSCLWGFSSFSQIINIWLTLSTTNNHNSKFQLGFSTNMVITVGC